MTEHSITKEMDIYDLVFLAQQGNESIQNHLLQLYAPFIAKCASEVCKRYIYPEQDDEFSIGLLGFNEAIMEYSPERGSSFFSFANLVIKRRIIDYIRSNKKNPATESLDASFDEEKKENQQEIHIAKVYYKQNQDAWYRKEEIKDFKHKLKQYNIALEELPRVSPKHKDARESAVHTARILFNDAHLRAYVHKRKKIPIKGLLKKVKVSQKTLERNRKFILATFIVISEDYLYLKEYLKGMGQ